VARLRAARLPRLDLDALRRPSLARRLVLLALGWSVGALVIVAILLAFLFQQAAIRRVDQGLKELIDNLVRYSTVDAQTQEVFAPPLTDERALAAYSGRYWEIAYISATGEVFPSTRSYSLFDAALKTPPDLAARFKADAGARFISCARMPFTRTGPAPSPGGPRRPPADRRADVPPGMPRGRATRQQADGRAGW